MLNQELELSLNMAFARAREHRVYDRRALVTGAAQ